MGNFSAKIPNRIVAISIQTKGGCYIYWNGKNWSNQQENSGKGINKEEKSEVFSFKHIWPQAGQISAMRHPLGI